MNNLLTRNFHETIGRVIQFEMNDDIALGQALMDRIPSQVVDKELNPIKEEEETTAEDIAVEKLYSKMNFNLPDTKFGLIEKILINEKDYWSLFELYNDVEPYNKLPKMSLYTFVRNLVGKPLTKAEYQKINNDVKSIKKSMKQIKNKTEKMKKNRGNFTCDFV